MSLLLTSLKNHPIVNYNWSTPLMKSRCLSFLFHQRVRHSMIHLMYVWRKRNNLHHEVPAPINMHLCFLCTWPSSCVALCCLAFCFAPASCTSESRETTQIFLVGTSVGKQGRSRCTREFNHRAHMKVVGSCGDGCFCCCRISTVCWCASWHVHLGL